MVTDLLVYWGIWTGFQNRRSLHAVHEFSISFLDEAYIQKLEYEVEDVDDDPDWMQKRCTDLVIYENGWVKFTNSSGTECYIPEDQVLDIQKVDG